MRKQEFKPIILSILGASSAPLSLAELTAKLPQNVADKVAVRTLRRWLAELIAEGVLEKLGTKKTARYRLAKSSAPSPASGFSHESLSILDKVRRPLYEREIATYKEAWFEAYVPNSTFYLPLDIRTRLYAAGKKNSKQEPAGTYAHQIFNRLLIDLSYNSSRLEGNTYTLLETERLILKGQGAEGKLDEEKVMILNHKEAIRYLVDTAPRLVPSKETLFTVHYLLAEGLVEPQYAGKVRDQAVRIGGSTYVPFEDPHKLRLGVENLCIKASLIEDPYEQSFFLLVHLSYLQPFIDVNKRTARLAANIPLIRNNLVPLSFNEVDRSDYISALLAIYEFQSTAPLVDLYTASYLKTCDLYSHELEKMGFDPIRVRYRENRRSLVRSIILNRIPLEAAYAFAQKESAPQLPAEDLTPFLQTVLDDLKYLDEARLAGLGVSAREFRSWKGI